MKRELIAVTDDLSVCPESVVAIKRSDLDADHCTIFLAGQSSQDGFVVERDADELLEEVNEARSDAKQGLV